MIRSSRFLLTTIACMALISISLKGQHPSLSLPSEKIDVIKIYAPQIQDAERMKTSADGSLIIPPSTQQAPSMNYQISEQFLNLRFTPPAIKPLALKYKPEEHTEKFWLKAGIGNHLSPLAELALYTPQSENWFGGLHLSHLSAQPTKEQDSLKRFSEYAGLAYLEHYAENYSVGAEVGYNRDKFFNYAADSTSLETFAADELDLLFQSIEIGAHLKNKTENFRDFRYELGLNHHYFWSEAGVKEHFTEAVLDLNKEFDSGFGFGLRAKSTWANLKDNLLYSTDSRSELSLDLSPFLSYSKPFGSIEAGLSALKIDDFELAPKIKINIHLIEQHLTVYGLWEKTVNATNWKKFVNQTPFLDGSLNFENGLKERRIGGVKANIGGKLNIHLWGGWQLERNRPLFITNFNTGLRSFSVDYLKELESWLGVVELNYTLSKKTRFFLNAEYNRFELGDVNYLWNEPRLSFNFGTKFSLFEPLHFSFRVLAHEGIYSPQLDGSVQKLKTIVDVGLSAEYEITRHFHLFGQVNNLISEKYERWYLHDSYGLWGHGGLILRF